MNMKNWKWAFGVVLMFAVFFGTLAPLFSDSQNVLYVNGKKIETAPYLSKGQVYVPLSPIVEGMGDDIMVDSAETTAAVLQGKKEIVFTLNSVNVLVNGKNEYLHVKETKWATAPTGFDVKKQGKHLYIPVETLSQILGYEVSSKKDGSRYIVQVGKQGDIPTDGNSNNGQKPNVDENPFVPEHWKTSPTGLYQETMSQYPLPDGIKPFKQKTKEFGNSAPDNFKILGDELGFTDINNSGAAFVPYGANATFYMSYEKDGYYYLVIEAWKSSSSETNIVNLTPYSVKSTFQLFFGEKEGTKFFDTFEKGMNGDKAILKYVDKINTINDRQLKITDLKSSIVIRIGEKGKNYSNINGWK